MYTQKDKTLNILEELGVHNAVRVRSVFISLRSTSTQGTRRHYMSNRHTKQRFIRTPLCTVCRITYIICIQVFHNSQ